VLLFLKHPNFQTFKPAWSIISYADAFTDCSIRAVCIFIFYYSGLLYLFLARLKLSRLFPYRLFSPTILITRNGIWLMLLFITFIIFVSIISQECSQKYPLILKTVSSVFHRSCKNSLLRCVSCFAKPSHTYRLQDFSTWPIPICFPLGALCLPSMSIYSVNNAAKHSWKGMWTGLNSKTQVISLLMLTSMLQKDFGRSTQY